MQKVTKLADFGVSAELTASINKRKTVIGTPYWMAPEVLQSSEYDQKADIWSLGITAIELATGQPPHADVHPMRAIFKIPNSPPPTLPEPAKYSKEFNDFLAVCLQKDPALRPTADTLLRTNPFVLKAKPKAVIASLVDECMNEIEEYRKADTEGANNEGGEEGEGECGASRADTGTMISPGGTGGGVDSGTMVVSGGSGTMVQKAKKKTGHAGDFDSGTMVQKAGDDGEFSSGTMVISKSDAKQPDYMKGHEKKGTNGVTATPGAYKTGKGLEVSKNASAKDLSASIAELDRAAEEEMAAVQKFYQERRNTLKAMLAAKAAEEAAAGGAPAKK